jgi:hypothetical protein
MIRAHLPAQLVIFVFGFAIEVTVGSATREERGGGNNRWSDHTVVVKPLPNWSSMRMTTSGLPA